MAEGLDPIRLSGNATARRLWLLQEAMRSLPFDRAVELARIAEAFVLGCTGDAINHEKREGVPATTMPSEDPKEPEAAIDQISTSPSPLVNRATERDGLALSDDDRDRLLGRLADGARNAEVAAEFGVSAKQVQGLRMGCAREIARRRATPTDQSSNQDPQDSTAATSIEEIVRYLRQQDDVVVPQEDGGYMVNGRFRLSAAELMARANRMRSRQRKPVFQMHGTDLMAPRSGPTGHPLFWEDTPRAGHSANGRAQPPDTETDAA